MKSIQIDTVNSYVVGRVLDSFCDLEALFMEFGERGFQPFGLFFVQIFG